MTVAVVDPLTNEIVAPDEYQARLNARRGRCRVGSPVMMPDWGPDQWCPNPIDGKMMYSRHDHREVEKRYDVECVGNDSSMRPGAGRRFHPELPGETMAETARRVVEGGTSGNVDLRPAEQVVGDDFRGRWAKGAEK